MNDHPVHTMQYMYYVRTANPHPSKMDVLPKTFLQIILAAKCGAFKYVPQAAATTFVSSLLSDSSSMISDNLLAFPIMRTS